MNTTTFLLMRIGIGISLFGHGLVRVPKLRTFSNWMVDNFSKSILPDSMVTPFAYALPVAELLIGLSVISGLLTKVGLIGGSIEMILLIFGSCMMEMWEIIPSQLIHLAFCATLLQFIASNNFALDNLF